MPALDQNTTRRRGVGTRGLDEDQALDGYTLIAPLTGKTVGVQFHPWQT